jgi:ferritin-like metal-binding protein YciE
MPSPQIAEQVNKYLSDAHSIERQALVQMRLAPRLAGTPRLAAAFRDHQAETEEHERLVRERMLARGATPSTAKDLVMAAGGVGFALFARTQPDTPGKLTSHALSYEHLELASYEMLRRVAERGEDPATADVARRIADQERAMGERLAASFDDAVEASLRAGGKDDLGTQLVAYLRDAHAIETQAEKLLEQASEAGGPAELERAFADHLEETRAQRALVRERLEAHGGGPSRLKDTALKVGALNWGTFFQAHPDTPGKLAVFAYAFEHLEIGGYEQLKRVAARAEDAETVAAAERILGEERAAAQRLWDTFDAALDASLEDVGAAV